MHEQKNTNRTLWIRGKPITVNHLVAGSIPARAAIRFALVNAAGPDPATSLVSS